MTEKWERMFFLEIPKQNLYNMLLGRRFADRI